MLKATIYTCLFLTLIWNKEGLPTFTIPVLMALLIAFSMRIVSKFSNNTITFKDSFIRFVYAFLLCYMALFIWEDFGITHNPVYAAFVIGLLSMEIVSELIKVLEVGLKARVKKWINNIAAKNEDN